IMAALTAGFGAGIGGSAEYSTGPPVGGVSSEGDGGEGRDEGAVRAKVVGGGGLASTTGVNRAISTLSAATTCSLASADIPTFAPTLSIASLSVCSHSASLCPVLPHSLTFELRGLPSTVT